MPDVKELLGRALPPQTPPITITRDSAVSAGRRARRLRRAWMVATSAVLILAAIAGVALLTESPGRRAEPIGPPTPPTEILVTLPPDPPTSVGPTASATDFPQTLRPLTEPTSAAATRLTSLTQAWASHALRGYQISDVVEPVLSTHRPALVFESDGTDLVTTANLIDGNGNGAIDIVVWARGSRQGMSDFNTICKTSSGVRTCESRIGPRGEHIVIRRIQFFPDNPGVMTLSVAVAKPDGTEIIMDAWNMASGSSGPGRAEPPLGAEDMLELLLDPRFTLYP